MMHQYDGENFIFRRCEECHFVWLDNPVAPEQLGDYYQEYYLPYRGPVAWGKYSNLVAKSLANTDKKRVELSLKHLDANQHFTALDVGCGKPSYLLALHERSGADCYGIDFSDHGWKNEPSYELLNLSTQELAAYEPRKAPDLVTMWHYLEHDYDPRASLQRLHDISSDEAIMIIEVPNYDSESRKRYGNEWAGWHSPRHISLFSPDNLSMLLDQCGWDTLYVDIHGTLDPYNLYWMSEMEKLKINWSDSMEDRLISYVKNKILFDLRNIFGRKSSHGIMTLVAQRRQIDV